MAAKSRCEDEASDKVGEVRRGKRRWRWRRAKTIGNSSKDARRGAEGSESTSSVRQTKKTVKAGEETMS